VIEIYRVRDEHCVPIEASTFAFIRVHSWLVFHPRSDCPERRIRIWTNVTMAKHRKRAQESADA
jgi:hypothetical protein